MRGRHPVVVGAMAAVLLVASAGCRSASRRARSHRDLVKAGMTPSEVQATLGDPVDRWVKEDGEQSVWLYQFVASGPGVFEIMLGVLLVAAVVVLIAAAAGGGGGGFHLGGLGGGGGGGGRAYEFEVHFDEGGRVYGVTEIEAVRPND